MGLSTPTAIMVGTGRGPENGATPGHGVEALVEYRRPLLENPKLMKERGFWLNGLEGKANRLRHWGKTAMFLGLGSQVAVIVALADTLKRDARGAL
jgi:Cu+-exporting ATPase